MRIAVHGSYFGYNFGDTLLCRLFVDWVRASGSHEVVLPLANEANRQLIGADSRGLLSALGSERVIFCGGGYFSESPSRPRQWSLRTLTRHLMLGRVLRARGTPLALMGVGIGPVQSGWVRGAIVDLFECAEVAIVRDDESAAYLRDWGVRRDVVSACDAVLAADFGSVPRRSRPTQSDRQRLLVHSSGGPSDVELGVVRAACLWAVDKDVDVVLVTDGVRRRGPIRWPSAIAQEFPSLQAEVHFYDGDPTSLINFIADADGILTTKLHVGIVGTILSIPVLSVPEHSKTIRFYRQTGHADRVIDSSAGDWSRQLNGLLDAWRTGQLRPLGNEANLPSFDYPAAIAQFLG